MASVFSVSLAMASDDVEMPTTKVGKPAILAALTAASAAGESSGIMPPGSIPPLVPPIPALAPQLGSPSVASSRNFGFGSVSVRRYATAAVTAAAVGVLPFG